MYYNVRTMALNPRKHRQFTDNQKAILEVVVNDYGGFVTHGHTQKIADRVGCSISTVSKLLTGKNPEWTAEKSRRIRDVIPLMEPEQQAALLQKMLSDSLEHREKRARPMTDKDPVDILAEIRKTSQQPAVHVQATQNIIQQNVFGELGDMSDEQLSKSLRLVEQLMRADGDTQEAIGRFLQTGSVDQLAPEEIIDAEFSELGCGAPGDASRATSPDYAEGQEAPQDRQGT